LSTFLYSDGSSVGLFSRSLADDAPMLFAVLENVCNSSLGLCDDIKSSLLQWFLTDFFNFPNATAEVWSAIIQAYIDFFSTIVSSDTPERVVRFPRSTQSMSAR
jgi:hypothetical protein